MGHNAALCGNGLTDIGQDLPGQPVQADLGR